MKYFLIECHDNEANYVDKYISQAKTHDGSVSPLYNSMLTMVMRTAPFKKFSSLKDVYKYVRKLISGL